MPKMKFAIPLLAAGLLLAAGPAGAEKNWTIETANKGPAQMVIDGGKTGGIPFPHQNHQTRQAACKPCHELFPQEKGAIERLQADGSLKKKAVMKTCQKCHRKLKKAGEKSGPTGCRDCHSIR